MPELTTIPEARLSELKDGLTRLARDEALRTRVTVLMDRLRDRPGHETTVVDLLRLVTEDLGSQNVTIYYRIDDAFHRLDADGRKTLIGEADDGLVHYVFETGEAVSKEPAFSQTGTTTSELTGTVRRVVPLLAGAEVVGVLRFDDPSVAGRDLREEVRPLLPFASVVLRNEIEAEKLCRRALEDAACSDHDPSEDVAGLQRREAELEQAKDELERHIAERSAELTGILEGTSSPVFSLDREYRYVAFNRSHASAMRALFGTEIEIGRSLLDSMTVAQDRETARKNLDRALAGEHLIESSPSGEEPRSRKCFEVSHHPVLATDGSVIGVAVFASDVTERQHAEEDRLAHLRFFESLDLVNRALQGTNDLEQMMGDVLDAVLAVFGCDRAWLVYPCDPASATYRVPMERARPEYPGALARGLEMPVDPQTARVLEAVKSSNGPVTFGPGLQEPLPTALSQRFQVQSQIAVAVYPKVSLPYVFGLHQCSYLRTWTLDDRELLQEIGRRLGDALTSLRTYRDLEGSEKRYRTLIQRIQAAVVVHGADARVLASNPKAQELLGLSEDQLLGKAVADRGWRFFRADGSVVPPEEYPAHRVCVTRQPLRDLVARIHRSGKDGESDVWVLVNADPVLGSDGEVAQVIVTFSDITELERAEGRLHREAERGSLLLDLFLRSAQLSEKQVYDDVLGLAVRLTGSAIGFLHRVSDDQKSVQLTTWNEAALEDCSAVLYPQTSIEEAGAWVDCVRLGRSVTCNDDAASPDQKCLPPGHAPLRRFMSVPVIEGNIVRVILGVGNKDVEYDEDDVFQIQQIAGELQKLVRQRHAVERVELLGRLYRTVSEMNQVIVREKSRDRLLAEVCRIGVEHGEFAMVWAGLVDLPGGTVRPIGAAGLEANYAEELEIRLDSSSDGLRPAARAVVEDRAVVVDDTETDPGFAPWREAARKRAFRSCAAFPVRADGSVLGVLAVYASEVGVFHGEVAVLLGELAADLGFALRALETEELRARTEDALRESEQKYRMLAESSPENIIRYDADGRMVYFNANLERTVGYGFASRIGTVPEEDHPAFAGLQAYLPKLQQVLRSGQPDELEMDVPGPAGETRTHSILFVAERSDDGRVIGALAFGRDITDRKEADREKQRYLVQLRQNLEDAVAAIAATVEARDPYTAGHQKRVAALAAEMARELGLDEETVQGIHLAGTIHDLGKIKIPAEILARPGGLSALETRLVRIHPEAGWEILKGVEFPWPIAEMVLEHHERMNGSGYPRGLRGEQISLGARILAVADVVEAVASHRPYRPSRGLAFALSDIEEDRDGCFDPVVVKACLTLFREKGYQFRD